MTTQQAFDRAAALCARSEHCLADIRAKLEAWEAPKTDAVLRQLVEERYIDESRYARAFAKDKLRYNSWGRIKIRAALRMKGVADSDISEALAELDEEEYLSVLDHVLEARRRQLRSEADAFKLKQKLLRNAASHGFEVGIILERLDD